MNHSTIGYYAERVKSAPSLAEAHQIAGEMAEAAAREAAEESPYSREAYRADCESMAKDILDEGLAEKPSRRALEAWVDQHGYGRVHDSVDSIAWVDCTNARKVLEYSSNAEYGVDEDLIQIRGGRDFSFDELVSQMAFWAMCEDVTECLRSLLADDSEDANV